MRTTPLTPSELAKSNNDYIKNFQNSGWFMEKMPKLENATAQDINEHKKKRSVLFEDANRQTSFNGEIFSNSPEYKSFIGEETPTTKYKALNDFAARVLLTGSKYPAKDFFNLSRSWNQSLFATHRLCISAACQPNYLSTDDQRVNIGKDEKGVIFVETIATNFKLINYARPFDNNLSLHIPGTVVTRFDLTNEGFKLASITCSNKILVSFFQNQHVAIIHPNTPVADEKERQENVVIGKKEVETAKACELGDFKSLLGNKVGYYAGEKSQIYASFRSEIDKGGQNQPLFYNALSLLNHLFRHPNDKNALKLLNEIIDSFPAEVKNSSPVFDAIKSLGFLPEPAPLPSKPAPSERIEIIVVEGSEKKITPNSEVTNSPFGEYLKKHNEQLQSNLAKDVNTIGQLSRLFNNFPDYDGVQHLTSSLKEAIRNKEPQYWVDLVTAKALSELFDENGSLKKDIYQLINHKGLIDKLISIHDEDEVKRQLLCSFLTNMFGRQVGKADASVMDINKENAVAIDKKESAAYWLNKQALEKQAPSIHALIRYINSKLENASVKSPLLKMDIATFQLEIAINKTNDEFKNLATDVLAEVKLLRSKTSSPERLKKLTEVLIATKDVITAPTKKEIDNYKKLANEMNKTSWGKKLGAAMLVLAGVALIAASVLGVVASAGLTAPISIGGVVLGASFVATAFGVTTAGSLAASIAGGLTLFKLAKPSELKKKMDTLADKAKPR